VTTLKWRPCRLMSRHRQVVPPEVAPRGTRKITEPRRERQSPAAFAARCPILPAASA